MKPKLSRIELTILSEPYSYGLGIRLLLFSIEHARSYAHTHFFTDVIPKTTDFNKFKTTFLPSAFFNLQKKFTLFCVIGSIFFFTGCTERQHHGPKYDSAPSMHHTQTYSFAVHPLHNPQKMSEEYQPLVNRLNTLNLGFTVELEASRDYGNFEEKIRAHKPEFLLPNPWQTLQAIKNGYSVIAMAGEASDFKGIILVRRDSKIKTIHDLKGKSISYPSPTALAACIMPQYFLYINGINVNTELENKYVGSQESSIMNACLKQTHAAATWPPPWRAFQKDHPAEAAELKILCETPSLINNSVMVRNDVPDDVRKEIRKFLTALDSTSEGRAILEGMETARFIPASDADYDVVRTYVAQFEKEVRPVEEKK
jgi:phosphonate transport system substrate-binding protein